MRCSARVTFDRNDFSHNSSNLPLEFNKTIALAEKVVEETSSDEYSDESQPKRVYLSESGLPPEPLPTAFDPVGMNEERQ